uniref:CCR4-NOT transcription complex subunit 11 n=1 Tax=Mesocestoides corti TaxID=53468 RepID=A0A5K3EXZ2_MESCO
MDSGGRPLKNLYDEFEGTYAAVARDEVIHSMTVACKTGPHITDFDALSKAPIQSLLHVLQSLATSEKLLKEALAAYSSVNLISSSDDNGGDERPTDAEVIRFMVKDPDLAPIIQSRILCILHNVPARMFRAFETKSFNVEVNSIHPQVYPEDDEKRLIELLQQMTKLSSYLVCSAMKDQEEYVPEIYKMRMASLLDDLREEHPELVPQLSDIWYFTETSELEGLLSVVEYLDRNDKPDTLFNKAEQTWPIPTRNFFYE